MPFADEFDKFDQKVLVELGLDDKQIHHVLDMYDLIRKELNQHELKTHKLEHLESGSIAISIPANKDLAKNLRSKIRDTLDPVLGQALTDVVGASLAGPFVNNGLYSKPYKIEFDPNGQGDETQNVKIVYTDPLSRRNNPISLSIVVIHSSLHARFGHLLTQ